MAKKAAKANVAAYRIKHMSLQQFSKLYPRAKIAKPAGAWCVVTARGRISCATVTDYKPDAVSIMLPGERIARVLITELPK